MSANEPVTAKPAKSFDSAFRFSFAIAIGLILFIAGLVISLTLGGGASIGAFFGIPLLLAGLVVPLIMMRGPVYTKRRYRSVSSLLDNQSKLQTQRFDSSVQTVSEKWRCERGICTRWRQARNCRS